MFGCSHAHSLLVPCFLVCCFLVAFSGRFPFCSGAALLFVGGSVCGGAVVGLLLVAFWWRSVAVWCRGFGSCRSAAAARCSGLVHLSVVFCAPNFVKAIAAMQEEYTSLRSWKYKPVIYLPHRPAPPGYLYALRSTMAKRIARR